MARNEPTTFTTSSSASPQPSCTSERMLILFLVADLVCFLDVSSEEASKRGGFGTERYEKKEFQANV